MWAFTLEELVLTNTFSPGLGNEEKLPLREYYACSISQKVTEYGSSLFQFADTSLLPGNSSVHAPQARGAVQCCVQGPFGRLVGGLPPPLLKPPLWRKLLIAMECSLYYLLGNLRK